MYLLLTEHEICAGDKKYVDVTELALRPHWENIGQVILFFRSNIFAEVLQKI